MQQALKEQLVMSVEDYAYDYSMTHRFATCCDEQHWEDGVNTEWFWNDMLDLAAKEGLQLTGTDDFDYDKFFYSAYQDTEKGLS